MENKFYDIDTFLHMQKFMKERERELMAYFHREYNPDPKKDIRVKPSYCK